MDPVPRVPPADMRRWVTVRDEICRFPGCNRPAHLCDIDHVVEWQHGGITATGNLVSVCRPQHRAKTAALWQEELLANGVVRSEDPWGTTFDDPPSTAADPAPTDLIDTTDDTDDIPPFWPGLQKRHFWNPTPRGPAANLEERPPIGGGPHPRAPAEPGCGPVAASAAREPLRGPPLPPD